jgi:hypothetical protein
MDDSDSFKVNRQNTVYRLTTAYVKFIKDVGLIVWCKICRKSNTKKKKKKIVD